MKVILKEVIDKLGNPGDIVKVTDGYARNFLLPHRKALPATEHNIQNIESYKKQLLKTQAENKAAAETVASKLSETECVIEKRAGKNNKLFGAVTSADIYEALSAKGFKLDKKSISLENLIKETGDFEVTVRLHAEVKATVKVTVKPEQ